MSNKLSRPVTMIDHLSSLGDFEITLLEYGDFECSSCGAAYPLIKALQYEYGHRLRFAFRNFPLSSIHPNARRAAMAAEAAGLRGRFWEMHDLLFENQQHLEFGDLLEYASYLQLDIATFRADMAGDVVDARIEADLRSGVESGVTGTPTFFINGNAYTGDWGNSGLEKALRNGYHLPTE